MTPRFLYLPADERGPYLALSLAMLEYAGLEARYKGRDPQEDHALHRAWERIGLACEAIARSRE